MNKTSHRIDDTQGMGLENIEPHPQLKSDRLMACLLIRNALNAITVRAEPVEAPESVHISTSSMRTDSRIMSAGSIRGLKA